MEKKYIKEQNEIKTVKLKDLRDFTNHPFKVIDDNQDMEDLISSIRENGLIEPILIRPNPDGKYEIISGHRRKKACEILGLKDIKCIIKDFSDDEAVINMVDSNIKREKILPSEKAFAYKMRLEAMNHQGKKNTLDPSGQKLNTRQQLANDVGDSSTNIYRYIRLTNIIPQLLELVDQEEIGLRPAVEISFLTKEEQNILYLCIKEYSCTPSHDQAIRMRKLSEKELLDMEAIDFIMNEVKPNQKEYIKLDSQIFRKIIPRNITPMNREEYIYKAIDFYNRYLQKQKQR